MWKVQPISLLYKWLFPDSLLCKPGILFYLSSLKQVGLWWNIFQFTVRGHMHFHNLMGNYLACIFIIYWDITLTVSYLVNMQSTWRHHLTWREHSLWFEVLIPLNLMADDEKLEFACPVCLIWPGSHSSLNVQWHSSLHSIRAYAKRRVGEKEEDGPYS